VLQDELKRARHCRRRRSCRQRLWEAGQRPQSARILQVSANAGTVRPYSVVPAGQSALL